MSRRSSDVIRPLAALVCAGLLGGIVAASCGGEEGSTAPPPGAGGGTASGGGASSSTSTGEAGSPGEPCPDGTDKDGDGYGDGCKAGPDCDDDDSSANPAAIEICDGKDNNCEGQIDEGLLTECGNCSEDCKSAELGESDPFPMPETETDVETDGVGLNEKGDLVLDQTNSNFNFLWIANTHDIGDRGTVSKVDAVNVAEVARYFSVTCFGNPAYKLKQCLDVAGNPVQTATNAPSRTAVDYNFDVWVANRAFGGQPSATKIANALEDCVDRNSDGIIQTSTDVNGDGHIDLDCNGDNKVDDGSTLCPNNKPPEFLGMDDECVLFTSNYAKTNEYGRSVCLDRGDPFEGGPGNAWVGTNNRPGNNRFYKLNGSTGQIEGYVDFPAPIGPYGCTVDGDGILWTVGSHSAVMPDWGGRGLCYFDTADTKKVGPVLNEPYGGAHHYYGITLDPKGNIWVGGWGSSNVYRYRPDRTTFETLANGKWTRVRTVEEGKVQETAGIAADTRGWVWVASNTTGYILRVPQEIPDGDQPWATAVGMGGTRLDVHMGSTMRGVGVDFSGHVWGISHDASTAKRIDLDKLGDPVDLGKNVFSTPVGTNPYTYSDFTGYGLRNFTRPQGTYRYLVKGCDSKYTNWLWVEWSGQEPEGTNIRLRARSGEEPKSLGEWFGYWETSPAKLADAPGPLKPMPAKYIQIELELSTEDNEATPILESFKIVRDCSDTPSN
ncbi:MAG: hypothetical protein HY744_12180 [Deltaproteobacteria bacterium]|nr:hypothetical protein [Deltaproteobacteria bacterium]